MVEMINDFMDMLVHSTITGICLAFWIIALMGIWKWFLGVMKRALFYLFYMYYRHQPCYRRSDLPYRKQHQKDAGKA